MTAAAAHAHPRTHTLAHAHNACTHIHAHIHICIHTAKQMRTHKHTHACICTLIHVHTPMREVYSCQNPHAYFCALSPWYIHLLCPSNYCCDLCKYANTSAACACELVCVTPCDGLAVRELKKKVEARKLLKTHQLPSHAVPPPSMPTVASAPSAAPASPPRTKPKPTPKPKPKSKAKEKPKPKPKPKAEDKASVRTPCLRVRCGRSLFLALPSPLSL